MRIELIILDSDTPARGTVDWEAVPRPGDKVAVPASVNYGDGIRSVESTLWHADGSVQVFLSGWMDGNCSDILIHQHGWSKYKNASPQE